MTVDCGKAPIETGITKRFQIRSLLWFDCAAAGVAGVAMLPLSGLLAPLFGIPRAVLVTMAFVNLAYGAFSYSLARQPEAPRCRVRVLVVANFAWTGVCVGLVAFFAGSGSWLGTSYMLLEALFVGVLGAVEARASTARPWGDGGRRWRAQRGTFTITIMTCATSAALERSRSIEALETTGAVFRLLRLGSGVVIFVGQWPSSLKSPFPTPTTRRRQLALSMRSAPPSR